MHKDQERIREALLPALVDRTLADDPVSVRDCTVMGRLLIQGPDPLFLMETCPDLFTRLCNYIGLPVDDGRDAIETAHWRGPGALLEGTGLPIDFRGRLRETPLPWRKEALWLILASYSDCTESGYDKDISFLERVRRAAASVGRMVNAINRLETLQGDVSGGIITSMRGFSMRGFIDSSPFTFDERGFPHGDQDHSFYVAYKTGYKVCCVTSPNGTVFWGTTPDTSLAEQGITVDKQISPQFGLNFSHKTT